MRDSSYPLVLLEQLVRRRVGAAQRNCRAIRIHAPRAAAVSSAMTSKNRQSITRRFSPALCKTATIPFLRWTRWQVCNAPERRRWPNDGAFYALARRRHDE